MLLDVSEKKWSEEICDLMGIDIALCPPLVESHEQIGTITSKIAANTGLSKF